MSRSSPRIAGGDLRGRALEVPRGHAVRPMRTRVRESVFGHLAADVEGASVLDAFAGSGAIGLEALSRGARVCTFFETSSAARSCLDRNIEELRVEVRSIVRSEDVYRAAIEPVDIAILDPPFPDYRAPNRDPWDFARKLLGGVARIVVVEFPISEELPDFSDAAKARFHKTYGDSAVLVLGSV